MNLAFQLMDRSPTSVIYDGTIAVKARRVSATRVTMKVSLTPCQRRAKLTNRPGAQQGFRTF